MLAGCLAACALATAAGRAEAADDSVSVSVSVATLAISGDIAEVRTPLANEAGTGGGKWLDMKLNENSLTGPYRYHGAPVLRLYGLQDPPGKPLAEAKLPEGSANLILVLLPNPGGYRALAIPESEAPEGSFFVMNFSPFPVAVELAGKREILKPGGRASMPGGRGEDQEVRIHAVINGKPALVRSTSWRLDANQREMVFFHTPPGTGRVAAKHILSTRPEPPAPAP
ncbi:MAG: hypothetical protein J0M04_11040 [Verrucomicrobia bacterium]|nr:hypothetical protein [Verrucomicrobiota bacterium]